MSLTIQKNEDEQRQLMISVEVPEERVQNEMQKVARKLGRDLRIPGFRRGKVPYKVVVGRFGEEAIRAEAADDLVESVFNEMLELVEEEPYAQIKLEDLTLEPVTFKFIMPLAPTIKLNAYRDIRKEIAEVSITDEAVDERLKEIQERHAIMEPVEDRGIQEQDVVTLSGKGRLTDAAEDDFIFEEERIDFLMDGEKVFFGPEFVAALLGLNTGDTKEFSISYAEDFADEAYAGKEANFAVEVLDIKSRNVPEIDDDLAQEEGDYETLDELKTAVREELQNQAERQAKDEFLEGMIDAMLENVEMIYPPAAVDQELDSMVANMRQQITQMGWQWEDYLKLGGRTEEEIRSEWTEDAETRLRRGLVLSQFIEDELIKVSDKEFDVLIEERVADIENEETQNMMREWMSSPSGKSMLANDVLMDKVYERLQLIATGEAPDLEALAAAEEE
ncbi:MAG: trigger factor [Anaerolineales bacterium]|nr:trigger factor [Anaerolineales bacterium]MCB0018071.1 trigger factor [Anaerolineales bacterium]MCB8962816.1 trigger factor [Ardenticatenales bacterium]